MEAAETGLRTSGSIDTASALLGRRRTLLKRVDYQMKGGGLMTISKWKLAGALAGMLALFLALSWALPGGQALAGKDGKDEEAVKVIKKPLPPGMEAKGITVTLHGQGKMDMDGHATDIAPFNKKFLDPSTGTYGSGTQTSYVLPLAFGMVPAQHRAKAIENLRPHLMEFLRQNRDPHPIA